MSSLKQRQQGSGEAQPADKTLYDPLSVLDEDADAEPLDNAGTYLRPLREIASQADETVC